MITISFEVAHLLVLKTVAVACFLGVGAAGILWPINDQPVSIMQKGIYVVYAVVVILLSSSLLNFTA